MSKTNKTGWERHNRVVFNEITENYEKVRWGWIPEIFEDIVKYSSPSTGKNALEIGAGTGKATEHILEAGYNVLAVEMSENMSDFLKQKFNETQDLKVLTSTFEDAELEDSVYDLIYAASAFHWVDADIGCPKVFRLLKDKGVFALIRGNGERVREGKLYDAVNIVYDKYYYSHYEKWDREKSIADMTVEDYLKPSEIERGFRFKGMEEYGFTDVTMKIYKTRKQHTADEHIKLLDTFSDHIALPEENRKALYDGVAEAINKNGGIQEITYDYQLYMGRKA